MHMPPPRLTFGLSILVFVMIPLRLRLKLTRMIDEVPHSLLEQ
jgi:hypothetical protein